MPYGGESHAARRRGFRNSAGTNSPGTFQKLSPGIVPWVARATMRLLASRVIFPSDASLMTNGIFILSSKRDDGRPPTGCRGQDPVISDKIEPGRRQSPESKLFPIVKVIDPVPGGAVSPKSTFTPGQCPSKAPARGCIWKFAARSLRQQSWILEIRPPYS